MRAFWIAAREGKAIHAVAAAMSKNADWVL